jgi:signal peptidase I
MSEKIKYTPAALKRADKKLKALLLKIVETKKGGTTNKGQKSPSRTLKEDTGDLKRSIKNAGDIITVKDGKLFIQIKVVEYFQYLDQGSKRIKTPWFITDEFTNSSKFYEAIEELIQAGIEEEITEIISSQTTSAF